MALKEKIYEIMATKKMKQSLVARDAGFDIKIFNSLLRGRKRFGEEEIKRICNALEVSPNDLFGWQEKQD